MLEIFIVFQKKVSQECKIQHVVIGVVITHANTLNDKKIPTFLEKVGGWSYTCPIHL